MYRDVLKKDGEKCARCGGTIKGYGHNGSPLINGRVCDKCNVDVVAFRMHMINIKEALKDFDLNKLCNLDYSFLIEKKAA